MLAAEEMGHKGVRAMTPLDAKLANDLRTKLGKGRDLPEEPVKPKRVPKPKAPVELGPDGTPIKKPARAKKAKPADAEGAAAIEVKPAATIAPPRVTQGPLRPAAPPPPLRPAAPRPAAPAATAAPPPPKPVAEPPAARVTAPAAVVEAPPAPPAEVRRELIRVPESVTVAEL